MSRIPSRGFDSPATRFLPFARLLTVAALLSHLLAADALAAKLLPASLGPDQVKLGRTGEFVIAY